MGSQLAVLANGVESCLVSSMDACASYRARLLGVLGRYAADAGVSEQQALQWTAERLVEDATNPQHELGAKFLPALARLELGHADAATVTRCIAQAAMKYLEGPLHTLACTRMHAADTARNDHAASPIVRACELIACAAPC